MARIEIFNNTITAKEIEDINRVRKDVFYFANFINVIHPIRGKVPFNLYPYQNAVLWNFLNHRFNIILKFRQAGITELISMYCLWLAMYHPHKTVVIISIKDRVAKKVLRKIKYMYKNLPPHLQVPIVNGRTGDYGCVTEDTILRGLNGDFRIGDITPSEKGWKNVEHLNLKVLAHNGEFERVVRTVNKGVLETYEIKNNRGKILKCTSNHRVYTTKGWKEVSEVLEKNLDVIFWDSNYLNNIFVPTTTKPKKEIILETKYPGYFVSNLGKVYTKKKFKRLMPDKLFEMKLRDKGFYRVKLRLEDGKSKWEAVHRLVYETFNGVIPNGMVIDHINCNRYDNYVTNLQCITKSENTIRAYENNRAYKQYNFRLKNITLRKLGKVKALANKLGEGYGNGKKIVKKLKLKAEDVNSYRKELKGRYNHIYTSKLELLNITYENIVDLEVENAHSYLTTNDYVNHNTAEEMMFSNGSTISSIPTTEEAGRSEAVSLLVIDEAAIVRWANQIWAAAFPTLSTGGSAIVNSTPYGIGNWYHKQWVDSIAGGNKFNAIRLRWDMHPERDMAWYLDMASSLGPRRTAQEIDGDFLSSGFTVFGLDNIKSIEDMLYEYKIIRQGYNGQLRIFRKPRKGERFFLGADIATGRAQDYSAFSIMDRDGDEVACFKGKISVDRFADLIGKMGKEFNNAELAPESNDIGLAVTSKLQNDGYPNLYYSTKILKKKGANRPETEMIPGWLTTSKNRSVIIDELEEDIRNEIVTIKDPFFVQEAYTFIYDATNRPVALGKHKKSASEDIDDTSYTDDSIMAKAITNHIRKGKKASAIVAPQ